MTKTAPNAVELESSSVQDNKTGQLKDIEAIIEVLRKSGREPLEADALAQVLLELSRGLKIE